MDNPNMWHIRDQIFDPLDHKTVLICRQVCKFWNESLARMSFVKLLQEFGDRDVERPPWKKEEEEVKVSAIVAGWNEAAKMFVAQASLEELQEVKDSLLRLARGNGKCCEDPVHEAARIGAVKLMEFILRTSFDMNAKDNIGMTAWHLACINDQTETAQLIIQSSKDFGIDLNAKDNRGRTAWHAACINGRTETAQLIIKSSKEFGIDLNAKDNGGSTAWHEACFRGGTETAQLIIKSSKVFGIDLNAKDNYGWTALHPACLNGKTETVQMILKNWKEFGIDIKAQNNNGKTALDLINRREGGNQIKEMLKKEYSQIDVTESVQSLNLD